LSILRRVAGGDKEGDEEILGGVAVHSPSGGIVGADF
jgi:hypothetical protein